MYRTHVAREESVRVDLTLLCVVFHSSLGIIGVAVSIVVLVVAAVATVVALVVVVIAAAVI